MNMILMILIVLIILIRLVWMILIRMIMTILIMMIIRKRDRGTWTDCAISGGREPESRSAGRTGSTCFRLTMVMMRRMMRMMMLVISTMLAIASKNIDPGRD